MDEFDIHTVARRSVQGIFALVSRTFVIQLLTIVASFVLTIYLSPANYGVYFVVSSIVVFLTYFQDIGLAAALIQKKDKLSVGELRATFTLQQILVLVLVIPALIFSANISNFFNFAYDAQILFVALIVSFFLSSLRTIPTVILEREVNFNRLVIPQIAEGVIYNICLILFAVLGFGVTTFTIAVLARSIIGLVLTYLIQPWPIGISFNFKSIKSLITFGIPFQSNTLLALVKDDLLVIYVGSILSASHLGFIGFAQKWAFMPLRLIMDNVIKITFPSYARLQHDKEALKLAIEKSLFLISFIIFPIVVFIIQYSPFLIDLIPKYQKWEGAILSLTLFALSTIFSSISTPLTNFLNAIGKVKTTLMFMVFWTVLTWIITPFMVMTYGYEGFAFASFLISLTSVAVIVIARNYVEFSFFNPVTRQLVVSLLMFVFIQFTKGMINSFPTLFLNIVLSSGVYLGVLFLISKNELVKTIRFIMISVRKEK